MKTILRISFVIVLLCLFALPVQAQDKEKKETSYWYVSYSKVTGAKVDSLVNFSKKYLIPIAEETKKKGTILDYKMLIHHTGTEYNVVYMVKYPSFSTMEYGIAGWLLPTFKEMEPDKEKQMAFRAAQQYVTDGFIHYDEIYWEVE